MFIDQTCGREKLKELLAFNSRKDILSSLGVGEDRLLRDWKKHVRASRGSDA